MGGPRILNNCSVFNNISYQESCHSVEDFIEIGVQTETDVSVVFLHSVLLDSHDPCIDVGADHKEKGTAEHKIVFLEGSVNLKWNKTGTIGTVHDGWRELKNHEIRGLAVRFWFTAFGYHCSCFVQIVFVQYPYIGIPALLLNSNFTYSCTKTECANVYYLYNC